MAVPFWQYETRQERRQREVQRLMEMATAIRPRIQQGDYQGAQQIARSFRTSESPYARRLREYSAARLAGKPTEPLTAPKPVAPKKQEDDGGGGSGFLGALKKAGGKALDALDAGTETFTDLGGTVLRNPLTPTGAAYSAYRMARGDSPGEALGEPFRDIATGAGTWGNLLDSRGNPVEFMERQRADFRERPPLEQIGAGIVFDPTNLLGAAALTKGLRATSMARQGTTLGRIAGAGARLNNFADVAQGRVLGREAIGAGLGALGSDLAGGDAEQNIKMGALGALGANLTRGNNSLPVQALARVQGREASRVALGLGIDDVSDIGIRPAGRSADVAPSPSLLEPLPEGASRYKVPEIGTEGAQRAIAIKAETLGTKQPNPIFRTRKGKLAALVNPSLAQDRPVYLAYNARQSVRSTLQTQFDAAMEPFVTNVEQALKTTPPVYRGPDGNAIAGTFKDIADHPDHYVMSGNLRRALDDYDRAQWEMVSAVGRAQYGVDVAPYASGIDGAIYTPTVPKRDATDLKIEQAAASLSSKSRTKTRAYAGAYDRMKRNPDFMPETDIRELTALHNQAIAGNAANETFKLGVGGKTRLEAMAELHPDLYKRMTGLRQRLQNLKGAQGRLETRLETAVDDFLRSGGEAADLDDLRDALDVRITRGANEGADIAAIKSEIGQIRKQLKELAPAWKSAGMDPYVFDGSTFRYMTPEAAASVKELMRQPEGFSRTFTEIMDEARASHLAGDMSPITNQGFLGLFADPVMAMNSARKTLGGMAMGQSPQAQIMRIAQQEADEVAQYTMATGRTFGKPIAEFSLPRGLKRVPGLRELEDQMFASLQLLQYDLWKTNKAFLKWANPAMTDAVAAKEAARAGANIIPGLNPAERGVSGLRGNVERSLITSVSFATAPAALTKDMASGMIKALGAMTVRPANPWRAMTGREQLALMRGGTLFGLLTGASVASAAAVAESRNMSIEDAIAEALDPDSKYFWSIQFGDGRRVAIGGPFRSFAQALYRDLKDVREGETPGGHLRKWAEGKVLSPITGAYRLSTNKDWRGNPIITEDGWAMLPQVAMYAFEQLAPTSLSAASEGIRTGESASDTAFNAISQFTGTNATLPTANDKLNEIARGRFGQDFFDLEPHQQEQIRKDEPDLWNESVARGSDQRQAYAQAKEELRQAQEADDMMLLNGEITREQWLEGYRERGIRLDEAGKLIYGDQERKADTPLAQYYAARDQFTVNGRTDFDALEAWLASQSAEDRAYIERNRGIGGTALVQAYRDISPLREEYYNLSPYKGFTADEAYAIDEAWQIVRNNARGTEDYMMLAALRKMKPQLGLSDDVLKGVRRRILGLLRPTKDRERFREQHPELAMWLGRGPLTAEEVAMLRGAM